MAQRGINKVILVGNIGQDPEVRFMPSGGAVANLTLATSETWKDKQSGEEKEKTEWHRVVIFGKLAEIAGEYVKKGSKVYIEGQLATRKWQDQDGNDRYSTEVVVQGFSGTMQMLDSRQGGQQQQPQQQGGYQQQPQQQQQRQPQQAPQQFQQQQAPKQQNVANNQAQPSFDENIPF